jgi:hypothetical protein
VTSQCTTPCVVMATPGQHNFEVQELLVQRLDVPNQPSVAKLSTRKTGWAITSGIFAAAGAATFVGGVILAGMHGGESDWGIPTIIAGGISCLGGVYGLVMSLRTYDGLSLEQHAQSESSRSRIAVGVQPNRNGGALLTAGSTF